MKLDKDKAAIIAAEQKLLVAKSKYSADSRLIEAKLSRQRPLFLIGGGLLTGVIAGRLPLIRLTQTIVSTFSLGASLARTPVGTMILGALVAKQKSSENAPPQE